jgi:FlaA1/EpsC-like NDP-sugar epimerase
MKASQFFTPIKRNFWLKLIIDAILFAIAFTVAFLFRYDFTVPQQQIIYLTNLILIVVLIKLFIFYFTGVYRIIWLYSSVMDFFRIIWANAIASLLIVLLVYFIFRLPIARSVIGIDALVAIALTAGTRFGYRLIKKMRSNVFWSSGAVPILIAGAGDTGAEIAREMIRNKQLRTQPVGFIDDDPSKQGMIIHGLQVMGTCSDLDNIIAKYNISEVIICMPTVSRAVIRDIFLTCQKSGVKCRTLPGIYQLIDGTVSTELIRDVQVEDILGREPVRMDLNKVRKFIEGKSVLIAGAGGSIGAELCRQINQLSPASLIALDQSESSLFEIEQELLSQQKKHHIISVIADITNRKRIKAIFNKYKPDVIFHAAAYKHVPLMESNLIEAAENNMIGTRIICEEAINHKAEKFILISTDKAVDPICNMGKTKALAEKIILYFANNGQTNCLAVRFGNVLDSSGSVVPTFRKQIAQGGPVSITHPDMKRYFMTIPEAVHLVIQSAVLGNTGEIFILDMGEQISIKELAQNMIRLSGFEPDKDIPLSFTGIRPGEKLAEKLFWDDEKSTSTDNPKIMVTSNGNWDFSDFEQEWTDLISYIDSVDEPELQRLIDSICDKRKLSQTE